MIDFATESRIVLVLIVLYYFCIFGPENRPIESKLYHSIYWQTGRKLAFGLEVTIYGNIG